MTKVIPPLPERAHGSTMAMTAPLPVRSSCQACPLGQTSSPSACPFHETTLPAGEALVVQGEVPKAAVWLKSGSVLITSVSPSGDETYCAVRGPGSLLALEAVTGRPALYQAWSLSPVTLCAASSSQLRAWLGDLSSPLGVVLELSLGEAERRREDRVALAGHAHVRLARFLLERARALGPSAPLEVQRQVLARMLGMRPETLSRSVAELRRRGVLAPGGLAIASMAELSAIAGEGLSPHPRPLSAAFAAERGAQPISGGKHPELSPSAGADATERGPGGEETHSAFFADGSSTLTETSPA